VATVRPRQSPGVAPSTPPAESESDVRTCRSCALFPSMLFLRLALDARAESLPKGLARASAYRDLCGGKCRLSPNPVSSGQFCRHISRASRYVAAAAGLTALEVAGKNGGGRRPRLHRQWRSLSIPAYQVCLCTNHPSRLINIYRYNTPRPIIGRAFQRALQNLTPVKPQKSERRNSQIRLVLKCVDRPHRAG
jgi:hypothetical protein